MPDRLERQRDTAESEARARLALDSRTAALAAAPFVPVMVGLSNFAWRAADQAGEWCVRLARVGTESLGADPASECRVLQVVAAAGLAPPILRCDPDARLLVSRWITGACPPAGAAHGDHHARLACVLAGLHVLPLRGDVRTVDFAVQADALEQALREVAERPLRATAASVFRELAREPGPPALCHNDLNPANMSTIAARAPWFVDWEYAGIGDPAFDLASCASQHELSHAMRRRFLARYRLAGGICAASRFLLARWASITCSGSGIARFRSRQGAAERNAAERRAAAH